MPADLRALLGEVIRRNASDLHISVGVPPAMRVDGGLQYVEEVGPLTGYDVDQALQTILTSEQMEKYKSSNELDFSFSYKALGDLEARFRGNAYFESRNMAAAFRLIPLNIRSIDDLSLPPVLKEISKRRRGLFLVTGPTGHGKSTTLAAILNEINNTRYDHIITIEDPIEYVYRSSKCLVHQREIGSDTESFSEGLRRALRQDPDVLLIGELRDLDTISAAITASETGHLVFGTLHTQDAAQSIDRIIDVFPPHHQTQIRIQLSTVLTGICSQQLIPKGKESGGGRICSTELLIANPAVRNCIREGKTNQIKTLIQTGVNVGMHTMEQSLAAFVKNKILSLDAALTYAYDPKDLQRILLEQQGAR
ncbi:MAG: type IV pilus twitching motility protein PilT [Synergistaceae bacterium]|nr:type IV pilus twitching motility protein PilT [Synergistaceae bacterium]